MQRIHFAILFAFSLLLATASRAETPVLERTITVSFVQDRMDIALKKIAEQGNFTFSYNPAILDASKVVTTNFAGMTVREILDNLFQGTVHYKARGNYIILTKAQQVSESHVYSGYVVDESTGVRLKNVSVYDPVSLSSAVTDAYGYFQIKIEKPSADLMLAINKRDYADTVVAVSTGRSGLLKIPLTIDKDKIATLADSVGRKIKRFWKNKIVAPKSANVDNIKDTLYRTSQFSVIPYVGTNHRLSGNVINDYSFNLFGGYSRGVQKFEAGGLFNLVRDDVSGVQLSGGINAVGGKTNGWQLAGLINLNQDTVTAPRFAGMVNLSWSAVQSFSVAGLINFTHEDSRSLHLAGISNMTLGKQKGPHIAGLFNFATHDATGVQVAGEFNFTAGNMEGAQVSGLINFTGGHLRGAQLSGLVNYATSVSGAQIGFLNISNSIKGVPIGFLSFVAKGYHKIEFSADEIFYTNIAFRTGIRQFYNIFTVGAKPDSFQKEDVYWTFGYGVGTAPKLTRRLSLNVDATANQVVLGNTIDAINLLNKVYLGVELQPLKNIGITMGITLNGYVTDATYKQYPDLFTDYKPHVIHDKTYSNDMNLKMWWGAKIGVRFL